MGRYQENEKIKMLDSAVEEVNNWVIQRREESDKIYKLKEGELF